MCCGIPSPVPKCEGPGAPGGSCQFSVVVWQADGAPWGPGAHSICESEENLAARSAAGVGMNISAVDHERWSHHVRRAEQDGSITCRCVGLRPAVALEHAAQLWSDGPGECEPELRSAIVAMAFASEDTRGVEVKVILTEISAGDEEELMIGEAGAEALGRVGDGNLVGVAHGEGRSPFALLVEAPCGAGGLVAEPLERAGRAPALRHVAGDTPAKLQGWREAVADARDSHALAHAVSHGLRDESRIHFDDATLRGRGTIGPVWAAWRRGHLSSSAGIWFRNSDRLSRR